MSGDSILKWKMLTALDVRVNYGSGGYTGMKIDYFAPNFT